MIILLCDGSCQGNPGECRIGVVVWKRSHTNKNRMTPLLNISEPIGIGTNNDAEWKAILKGLEVAMGLNDKEVYVYSDSQLVVNQALGRFKVGEKLLKYKALFLAYSKKMDIHICWLPRQLTGAADKLTREESL